MTQVSGRALPDVLQATRLGAPMSGAGIPGSWSTAVKNDATDITGCIGIYVGTTGDLTVRTINDLGTNVVFKGVPAGAFVPGMFARLMNATTAADMLLAYP